jgi:hypothetical protein
VAFIAAILYVLFNGLLESAWEFRIAPYPDQIARHLLLFVGLLLFINFVNSKKQRDLFLTVLVAATLATIHLYSWVHFLIAVGAFSAVSALFLPFETIKNGLKVIGSVLLVSAPYLAIKLQTAAAVVEPESVMRSFKTIFDGFYIVNPLLLDKIFYASILILAYLVFKYRKDLKNKPWLIFLASNALAGIFIIFNPFLIPILAKLISFTYTKRLLYLVYSELALAAFLVFEILPFINKSEIFRKLKMIFLIPILIGIVSIPLNFMANGIDTTNDSGTANLMRYIKANLPEKSVFASGLWLGIRIPAYTNNYIVMGDPTHITWNVDKDQRLEDTAKIFSAQTSIEDTVKLLDKYGVSYVVVSLEPKKQDVEIDVEKFANQKEFEEIYRNDDYRVYSLPEH